MRQISAPELARWLAELQAASSSGTSADTVSAPPLLLDVREPWEIERAAIDGVVAIPMREVPGALDTLAAERTTVCICHHGGRSLQVALFLESRGFTDVVNLAGGIHAWSEQVDASVPVY